MKRRWFDKGLQFSCTQCGHCCTGASGFVFLSEAEADILAESIGLDTESFRRRYTVTVHGPDGARLSLRERPDERGQACVFWAKDTGCTVYAQRPRQCRTWPFWGRVVANPGAWQSEAEHCPGMNQGTLFPPQHIQELACNDGLRPAPIRANART